MVTSAPAGLSPSIFMTQSYSGKIVVTILNFPSDSFAVPSDDPQPERQHMIITAARIIDIYFFIDITSIQILRFIGIYRTIRRKPSSSDPS